MPVVDLQRDFGGLHSEAGHIWCKGAMPQQFRYGWSTDSHEDQVVQLSTGPSAPVGLHRDATDSCSYGFSELKIFSMLLSQRLGTNHQEALIKGACSLITKQRLTGLGQGLDGFADQDPKIQEQRHLPEI